jgi:hypothetical protein
MSNLYKGLVKKSEGDLQLEELDIGNRFNVRTIFKIKHALRGILMKTGPVRNIQQTKQCMYNIPCGCGGFYIGETNRPLEVRIKEHKYNLTRGLLEKSKLAQHAYKEGH